MPAILPKRKQRAAPFKTSALESARRAGIAGVFAGPPDLAANRKKWRSTLARSRHGWCGAETVRSDAKVC